MRLSKRTIMATAMVVLGPGLGAMLYTSPSARPAFAQDSLSQGAAADKNVVSDEYQRSSRVYNMQRFGKSGWQRGEEIYYVRCWICHNDYTVKAESTSAPTLRGLYKRAQLWNGQPVSDETVAKQIGEGSPKMPAFGHTLDANAVADLVAYLRDKCCWNEYQPPSNPWYRY